ncbi:MAG: peptidoglycan editing factor PgeF [Phycisphaeraceae bacterium]|nr:peptidoglycan editing factor PgeF [Phycisphaeraceae bacterium]
MAWQRTTEADGLVVWRSTLLHSAGIPHVQTTRHGPVSDPVKGFDLVDVPTPSDPRQWEDSPAARRFGRLISSWASPISQVVGMKQVHGQDVRLIEDATKLHDRPVADALATSRPGVALVVRTADCVPVLLASMDGRTVAAVHAGWRGVVAGIVPAAVQAMRQLGAEPAQLLAAIGPTLCRDHFEIGPEVAQAMRDAQLGAWVDQQPGEARPHAELSKVVSRQLRDMGIPDASIDACSCCTWCHEDFYSHRRDQGNTGRMAALICPISRG